MAKPGKDILPTTITKYGHCIAYRAGDGSPIVITCMSGEMVCYTQEGNTVHAYDCDLVGDWGTTLSPSSIRFTYSSYTVISDNPYKVKYTGVELK